MLEPSATADPPACECIDRTTDHVEFGTRSNSAM
jgi:hypothetical protein